jgi:hypothetical protein
MLIVSKLIEELVNIFNEYGDIPCYINTNDNAVEVLPLGLEHVRGGSACVYFSDDDFRVDDDSDPVCYLGK